MLAGDAGHHRWRAALSASTAKHVKPLALSVTWACWIHNTQLWPLKVGALRARPYAIVAARVRGRRIVLVPIIVGAGRECVGSPGCRHGGCKRVGCCKRKSGHLHNKLAAEASGVSPRG